MDRGIPILPGQEQLCLVPEEEPCALRVWWHCLPWQAMGCPSAGTQVQSDTEAALELLLMLGRGSESQGKKLFYLLQNPPALGWH